jgi:hypothetical protein
MIHKEELILFFENIIYVLDDFSVDFVWVLDNFFGVFFSLLCCAGRPPLHSY